MKRIITTLLATVLLLQALPLTAQSMSDSIVRNPLDNLIIRTAVKQSMFPEERVYLHFDNTAYYLTETMWFKAYVMSGDKNEPTNVSRVLYVELVAPEGYVVKTKKYKIENDGTCHGEFELNPLLLSGYYEVRAYTRYMLNRGKDAIFSRVFPVFDKVNGNNWDFMNMLDRRRSFLVDNENNYNATGLERGAKLIEEKAAEFSLKFYPEGGHLVEGLECNVAFELFGTDGINSNRGITLLANDKPLMEIEPEFMGMGTFCFTPQKDVKYTAQIDDGKKTVTFNLPEVEKEGAIINTTDSRGNTIVTIKNNIEGCAKLGCAVLHRGKVHFYERYSSTDNTMMFFIDKRTLPEGVNRVVLFANDSIPLAERQFFVTRDFLQAGDTETAKLKITSNGNDISNIAIAPHSRIPLTIEREDGKPISDNGSFSLSVSDAEYRTQTSYTHNMHTYMLLGSELKGYIPDAARYFDIANKNRARELDLLMMTRGWSSYDWSKLSKRNARLQEPIEKGIMIKGRFVKKTPIRSLFGLGNIAELDVSNRPNTAITFKIKEKDSTIARYGFTTDKEGEFRILTHDFQGKKVAVLSPIRQNANYKDSAFSFILDRYFSPEMRLYNYWERNIGMPTTQERLDTIKKEMIRIKPFEYLLTQVEVTSKRKKEHNYRPPRSEMRFDFLDEWEYAQDVTYRSNSIDSWSRLYTENMYNESSRYGEHDMTSTDNLSAFDRQAMPSGWFGGSSEPKTHVEIGSMFGYGEHGFKISDPAYYNTLSAADILRSAFWRHNLDWCYWIHSMVVDGEYSSDSIPRPDEEYLKGIEPEKMLNFKEIIIRSDENTRKQFLNGHYNKPIKGKNKGNFGYSSYYHSFKSTMNIPPRYWNNFGTGEKHDYYQRTSKAYYDDIPNYVACFIPNSQEDVNNDIVPILSRRSTTRYTMVYGYNESKQFYSPDYSHMQPDSTAQPDYRRTLLWTPVAAVKEGKIEIELYNSSSAKSIAVDVEGYANGMFYSNNGSIYTKELSAEERYRAENTIPPSPIAGIHDPDLLVHSFKITEEGRTLFNAGEYEKAFLKFNEAATLGYSDALFNAAVCYLNGKGTERNALQAFRYFRKAANMEHVQATHNLASCYFLGIGTNKNDSLAITLYKSSGNKGYASSQTIIGNCYLNGIGVEQDSTEAFAWYERAAANNEPTALYVIAERLAKADSTQEMSKRQLRKQPAIKYYQKAAENGNALAQYKLARFYETGYYVKKNKKKAFEWYLRAANNNLPQAFEPVAVRYEKGRGTKKDEVRAAQWYSLAQKHGSETAKRKMDWYNTFHFFEE